MQIDVFRINVALVERQMTRAELEVQSGVSKNTLSTIFRRGRCSAVTAGKIAEALSIPASEIVAREEVVYR